MNVKLINDKKVYQRCVNKLNFISQKFVHCCYSLLKDSIDIEQTHLCWFLYFRTK